MNMYRFIFSQRVMASVAFLLSLSLVLPPQLCAQSPPSIRNFNGEFDLSTTPANFRFEGVAPKIGRFTGMGEIVFRPDALPGTQVGAGPVVLRAVNGDLLVGNMTCKMNIDELSRGNMTYQFHWSDSVTFHDGAMVKTTGRFVNHRPPGFGGDSTILLILAVILIGAGIHR